MPNGSILKPGNTLLIDWGYKMLTEADITQWYILLPSDAEVFGHQSIQSRGFKNQWRNCCKDFTSCTYMMSVFLLQWDYSGKRQHGFIRHMVLRSLICFTWWWVLHIMRNRHHVLDVHYVKSLQQLLHRLLDFITLHRWPEVSTRRKKSSKHETPRAL